MSSLLRSLSRFLRLGKSRHFIGTDLEGNSYYEYPSLHGSDDPRHTRRLIDWRVKKDHYCEYDTKNVAVQWKMWLRHSRLDAPTLQELEADQQRMAQLQENVRLIAIRDEERRQAAEVKRLQAGEAANSSHQQQQHALPDQVQEPSGDMPGASLSSLSSTAATAQPRPRTRAPTSNVPTAQIVDEGLPQQQRARRIPISVTQPRHSKSEVTEQGSRLAAHTSQVREPDNDVWEASRQRIQRQDGGSQIDGSGGRRNYITITGSGQKHCHSKRVDLLTSMRPGLGLRISISRRTALSAHRFSTGPVRPPRNSLKPVASAPPPPPEAQTSGIKPTQSQSQSQSPDPTLNVPPFVLLTGGCIVLLGLAIVWILPQEVSTLTIGKTDRSTSPSAAGNVKASSVRIDRWTDLPILRSSYTVSPSHPEQKGDGQHKLITLAMGPSSSSSSLRQNVAGGSGGTTEEERSLSISSISLAQPEIQIERPYTPLQSPEQADVEGKVDLLVKQYPQGEMGRYLHRLGVGETLQVRGWEKSWDERWMKGWSSGGGDSSSSSTSSDGHGVKEIIFIVGGTGITPAYQLISSTLGTTTTTASSNISAPSPFPSPSQSQSQSQSEEVTPTTPLPPSSSSSSSSSPKFKLLYASSTPSSFLLLPELKALQSAHPSRLEVTLFSEAGLLDKDKDKDKASWVDKMKAFMGMREVGALHGLKTLQGRIRKEDLEKVLIRSSFSSSNVVRYILLSGPEEMIYSFAGGRGRTVEGRLTQGPLGGILRRIEGVRGEEVWKL